MEGATALSLYALDGCMTAALPKAPLLGSTCPSAEAGSNAALSRRIARSVALAIALSLRPTRALVLCPACTGLRGRNRRQGHSVSSCLPH